MSSYQRNVVVGAVVLVGLGILAWMVLQFANRAASFFLTTGTKITLTTSRADGVADGSPITYNGVNVGRVTGVRRVATAEANGEEIVIDAIIEADPPLPANLTARIKQTSLLGASATIALERDPLAATRQSTSDGIKPKVLSEGDTIHANYVPDITSLGDNIRDLTGSLEKTISSINDVIGDPKVKDDMKVSLTNIREATQSAARLGKQLEKVSVDLESTTGEVRVTVKDARVEIKKLSDNLSQRMEQVAESLQHVQSVAEKIDSGKGTAGQLVNDPKLYESLSDTAAELNLMVKDMRRLLAQWEQEGIIKL